MIRFTEAVRQYSEEKKRRGMSPIVNSKEISRIRQLYKQGTFREEQECDDDDEDCKKEEGMTRRDQRVYERELRKLRDYKEAKGLGRGLTSKQKNMLREEVVRGRIDEQTILMGTSSKPRYLKDNDKTYVAGPKATMTEAQQKEYAKQLEELRNYKEAKGMGRGLTMKQKNMLRESIMKGTKVDVESIKHNIREARKFTFKAKMALKENDMLGAADATQAAADAVNAADAAVAPAAEGAVPQNIVDAISNIKISVDQLAAQCGIESPVDFGGDPNAGVPAVDGTMQDPNAGAPAPQQQVMESAKARLAKREAVLKSVKEGKDGQDAITQAILAMTNPQQFHDIDKKNSEEQVKPTTQKTKDAANTWPTVKGTVQESKVEQMITDRINEKENSWDFNRILREGILG